MREAKIAKFRIGQVVRHRLFPFRGVIFDVDPEFANTEEWYEAIPVEVRVFPLYVDGLDEDFPEAHERRRRWFAPEDAARMVAETGLKQILRRLPAQRRHPPE